MAELIKNAQKPVIKQRSVAANGTQWVVLSVLLLWLIGFAIAGLKESVIPTSERVIALLGSYLIALCLPGLILVTTSFKHESTKNIMACATAAAIFLTAFRFFAMSVERLDCNQDCANTIPYHTEMIINFSLPFILTLSMYLIVLLVRPRSHVPN